MYLANTINSAIFFTLFLFFFVLFLYTAKGSDTASSGTTATVCLLHDDIHLYIGHVGDSRAILCREGKAVKLTREHTPDDEEERDRIIATGGRVTWSSIGRPRVNGKLEMTRSIGDADLKAAGVTAEPDTAKIRVSC